MVGDMAYEKMGGGALDYFPCHYGTSKLTFRGPKRELSNGYAAFVGGTEIYGKFIPRPIPDLVESASGITCVNFGLPNAGVDVFNNDIQILSRLNEASVVVLQVMGANNLSNRFYSVHPRRNDRFLRASNLMKTLFRDVDFTEFHFTKHMLSTLARAAPDRFHMVVEELQQAWVSRMRLFLDRIDTKVVLLWFSDHSPEEKEYEYNSLADPFAIERWMLRDLEPRVESIVEVVASTAALAHGTEGMMFNSLDTPAAQSILGPAAQNEAAVAVTEALLGVDI